MTAVRRLQQGVRALLAFSQPVDDDLAARYLNAAQFTAFKRMARSEQLHSLNVLRSVLAQDDHTPHELALAALMHDVGKSRYHLAVWQKTVSVLVKRLFPGLDARLSRKETLNFWRAPFVVRRHHPAWSAEILAATGAPQAAIWLAAHHQEPAQQFAGHAYQTLLLRLQRADDLH